MGSAGFAVVVRKRYGETKSLDGFERKVPEGTVCGLLGPNGAGKTTAVRILSTLLKPDGGRAEVAGFDVVRQATEVRYMVGLAGQQAAVDEILTGRQNLVTFGRLYHLDMKAAQRRADELLGRFGLGGAADKQAKDYSGGMRRRLDLAASFILSPGVLFMDEPTTGLDPRGRNEVWESIRALVAGGTTVLLTTQYLDGADQLADRFCVIDAGRAIADGTPDELKSGIGGAPSSSARRARSVSATGRSRRTSSGLWASWSTPSRSGTPATLALPWKPWRPRASRRVWKTSSASRRCATSTSTCSAATSSRYPKTSYKAACALCAVRAYWRMIERPFKSLAGVFVRVILRGHLAGFRGGLWPRPLTVLRRSARFDL